MKLIENVREMQQYSESLRLSGKRLAVVPTMGALHNGHLALVRLAKRHADVVVMTIFVNPLQFAPTEDFSRYPRPFERDKALAASEGVDVLFHPQLNEFYAEQFETFVALDHISQKLEGKIRPTHFRGVATVVSKLFNVTKPHIAVFGEKDAQQLTLVRKMVRDLNFDIEIIPAPIEREADGLAMSSRNAYLSPEERRAATALFQALMLAEKKIRSGERNAEAVCAYTLNQITSATLLAKPDYAAIVRTDDFEEAVTLQEGTEYFLLLAVRFGNVRLLDNCRFIV
jgi:pantoate--beta-alanine ligase